MVVVSLEQKQKNQLVRRSSRKRVEVVSSGRKMVESRKVFYCVTILRDDVNE